MAVEFCMTRNEEEEEAADQCDEHPYDAVSLCDLPLSPPPPTEENKVSGANGGGDHITSAAAECSQLTSSESDDQFEFGWSRDVVLMMKKKKNALYLEANWPEMCSPEDVFANGQLLPFRPSVSSETSGLLEVDVLEKSNCRISLSRSESLGLNSCYFTSSSRNSSSSRSSFCDSSDHRRGRRSSVDSPAGLLYSNPPRSPIPRKRADHLFHDQSPVFSTSGKMGLFRLGLVRTPEIQLRDLRHRQKKKEDLFAKHESGTVSGSRKVSSSSAAVVGWTPWRRIFSGMDCKCSVVSDAVSVTITRRKGNEEDVKKSQVLKLDDKIKDTSRRRTFEWVNELSFAHRDYEPSNPIH